MLNSIRYFVILILSVFIFSFQSFSQQPTAVLSGTQSVCALQPVQLTVAFTGTSPWSFSYKDGTVSKTISGVTENPYVLSLTAQAPVVTYSLQSVSDRNYSSGTVSGSATVSWISTNFLQEKLPITISGPNPVYCPSGATVLSTTPGYTTYSWFKDNNVILNANNSSLTLMAAGSYKVISSDSCNIRSSLEVTVTLSEPFAKPVISGNSKLQCGSITTLTTTANYIKYDWMLNNAVVQSGSQNTVNVNAYGGGSYTVKVYDASGCVNTSVAFSVTEVKPTLNSFAENPLGLTSLRCLSGNNVLTATAGFNRYDWMLNGSVVKSGADNTIDAAVVGAGIYSVKVYYPGGCTSTSLNYPIQFQVSPPVPSITATSTLMCPGQIVSVSTNVLAGFISYLWSDGSTFNQINVSQPGTYTVTTTDFAGCTSSNSITIGTPATFQNVIVAATGPSTICQQTPADGALLQSIGTYSGYTYFWKKNGVQYKNPGPVNYMSATESGTYTLNLLPSPQTFPSVCYNTSNSIDVIVTPAPVTSSAIHRCGSLPSYAYTANGAGPNQHYKWYATYNSSAVLYTSTGPADNTYSHTYNLIYVSIYDATSGCETSRTPLGYLVDPTTIADKITTICSEQIAPFKISTPIYYNYIGTHKWYTVPTGGTPVYTSTTNVYEIPQPTQDQIFYVEFLSEKGCQTNRAKYTVKYAMPPTAVLTLAPLCEGSPAILTPSAEPGLNYFMYDLANNYIDQTTSAFSIPVPASGAITYKVAAIKDGCRGPFVSATIDRANVNPVPVNRLSFTALCDQSATVTFTGTALPSATFNWDFRGATIISGSGMGPYKIRWETAGSKIIVLQVIQNGCSSPKYSFSYTVPIAPIPSFPLANTTYCQNTTAVSLTGSPSGGFFSGVGISGSSYTPSTIGINNITYSYTNATDACVYTAVKTVTVNSLPVVSINGLSKTYCQSTAGVSVTVSPTGGTLTGSGISKTTFTPLTEGERTITYTYKDANNCSNTATQSVMVNALPIVSFTGLNKRYCQNSPAALLTGTPVGGTFSGIGVSDNTFTPSLEGVTSVIYSYAKDGCVSSVEKTTTVNESNTYIQFDGIDDFIKIPSIDAYNIGTTDFTVDATIIVDQLQSNAIIPLLYKSNGSDGFSVYLNKNQIFIRTGKDTYNSNSFFDINDGRTHLITITRTAGLVTFYFDKIYIGSQIVRAPSSVITSSNADLYVGRNMSNNSYFKGYIANVSFWNSIQLWPAAVNASSPGLLGYWPMTECDGQYIMDKSLYANNGVFGLLSNTESTDPTRSTYWRSFNPDFMRNAFSFNAYYNDSKHIEVPHHTAYETFNTGKSFTIEAKINSKGVYMSTYPTIISKRGNASSGFVFGIYNRKLFFKICDEIYYDNSNAYDMLTQGGICYHVAITRNNVFYTFYVNGVATSSFTRLRSIASTSSIWLGNDRVSNNTLSSDLDEVRIWNYCRSQTQLMADLNQVFSAQTNGLIGYFTFDENNESQWVIDKSVTDNHGFIGSSSSASDEDDPFSMQLMCNSMSRIEIDSDAPVTVGTPLVNAILYPNPFESNVLLRILNSDGFVNIQVIDAEGKIVYIKESHPMTEELIFGEDFPQGMYLIQFLNQPGLKPIKFIKVI
jgi:hypothetical protein